MACLASLDLCSQELRSAEVRFSEAGLKAAFLFNFTVFVEWPTNRSVDASSPLVIGILGREDVAASLQDLIQRKSGLGRPRVVRKLGAIDEAAACQLVFVGAGTGAPAVLRSCAGKPVLMVGEEEGFVDQGGGIEFALVGDHVAFDINQAAIEKLGLTVRSKVLGLARRVIRPAGGSSGK